MSDGVLRENKAARFRCRSLDSSRVASPDLRSLRGRARRAVFLFIRAQQHGADMRTITFLCPITRVMVQHRLADDEPAEHQFQGVFCPACSQLHFVDRKTGKLLGRKTDDSASSQSG